MSFSERIAAILETKEISEFYEFHGQNTKRMPNAVISKKTYFGVYDLLRECWKKSFNTSLDFVADLKLILNAPLLNMLDTHFIGMTIQKQLLKKFYT